jgi:hypothetical protein
VAPNHTPKKYIKALQRRLDWLTDRVTNSSINRSFDLAERRALIWALAQLTASQGEQKAGKHGLCTNRSVENHGLTQAAEETELESSKESNSTCI